MKMKRFLSASLALFAMVLVAAFTISCGDDNKNDGNGKNTLGVAPNNAISFEAKDNSEIVLTVTTDAEVWDYTKPSWVTATKNTAGKTLTINANNNLGAERSGVIKFTAGTATPVEINVSQKKGEDETVTVRTEDLMLYMPFDDVYGWIEEGAPFAPYDASKYLSWTYEEGSVGYLKGKKGNCLSGDNSGRILVNMSSAKQTDFNIVTDASANIPGIAVTAWVNAEWHYSSNNVIFSFQNYNAANSYGIFWGTIDLAIKMDTTTEAEGEGDPVYRIVAHLRNNRALDKDRDEYGQPSLYSYQLDKSYFESWHHIGFNYDCATSTAKLFIDGVKVDEQVIKEADKDGIPTETNLGQLKMYPSAYTRMSVGGWYLDGGADEWLHFFRGKIDEVRVYMAPLSEDDIETIYKDVD